MKQQIIVLSSSEAELYALIKAGFQILCILANAACLGMPLEGMLFTDSTAAIGMVCRTGSREGEAYQCAVSINSGAGGLEITCIRRGTRHGQPSGFDDQGLGPRAVKQTSGNDGVCCGCTQGPNSSGNRVRGESRHVGNPRRRRNMGQDPCQAEEAAIYSQPNTERPET